MILFTAACSDSLGRPRPVPRFAGLLDQPGPSAWYLIRRKQSGKVTDERLSAIETWLTRRSSRTPSLVSPGRVRGNDSTGLRPSRGRSSPPDLVEFRAERQGEAVAA